jgi:short-subunit dehydrogenase
MENRLTDMTETALITGASSGIGEHFARQLADRGHDLVLVARRADRLEGLAAELSAKTTVIAADLATDAASVPARVAELGLEVDLLINNAGFGTHDRFWEIPEGRDAEMVRLNCEAVVILTRAFLPAMVKRGRGGVITVASTAGMQPLPYEATYSASKAFALNFSDALHTELKGTGVQCLAVNPGPVRTEWQEVAGVEESQIPPGMVGPDVVVRDALKAYDSGSRSVVSGPMFRWIMRASRAPRAVKLRVMERQYRPSNGG